MNRSKTLIALVLAGSCTFFGFRAQGIPAPAPETQSAGLSVILGRPTDRAIALNVLSPSKVEARVEYGVEPKVFSARTEVRTLEPKVPAEMELDGLKPDTRYYYRVVTRDAQPLAEGMFHTQRAPESTFSFGVQGDSHPERPGKMFDSSLYALTMRNVAKDAPDFYLAMGDDFSIERLIERQTLSQVSVNQVYAGQRAFLGTVGRCSPLFLVNGNHEQAARCNLDGTAENCAILASQARSLYYPLPAPNAFYTGDAEPIPHAGLLRDYYAWNWGDALFVVIDPYWHSAIPVDNMAGSRAHGRDAKSRDVWGITLGDAQYQWLEKTLLSSKARWKFVFTHHVLGTGRGGIECASLGEWGGQSRNGAKDFASKRPTWDLPIHALMVKAGVTIFFQGHDHLFARQKLDGVVYQSCPIPADPTYQAFNRDAYRSGDILPNSGYLRVTVSPQEVAVDYIRSWLPKDETPERKNGETAFHYTIPTKARVP